MIGIAQLDHGEEEIIHMTAVLRYPGRCSVWVDGFPLHHRAILPVGRVGHG